MSPNSIRQRDALLGALATWSRTRLLATVFGGYLAAVLLFGLLYSAADLTSSDGLWSNLYFSLVTQATVGYGDVLPVGFGRVMATFQIGLGVGWAAFLPALVLIRLASPHKDTVRVSHFIAFDPSTSQFRLKVVNTGRFVGSRTSIQLWIRIVREGGVGRRTLPIAMRSQLPFEIRFPHLRPMLATGYRTDRAESPAIPAGAELVNLHPSHFAGDATLIVDVSIDTPFGTASRTEEFDRTHVVCGKHAEVQPVVDGPKDWSRFDEVVVTISTPAGVQACKEYAFHSTCGLISRVDT